MPDQPKARRPGGRSARVRDAVHIAAIELLGEAGWADIGVPAVARRAGVHPATVYRRWPSLAELIGEALGHRLATTSRIPDTGSLAGDVEGYLTQMAKDLAAPEGLVFLRAVMVFTDNDANGFEALRGRTSEIEQMLDRARGRGETTPTTQEFFELAIGPLYAYALFDRASLHTRAPVFARRVLALTG